ncbi:hypothetical protein EJ078_00155 [Mesorhizobium sp. M1A.F.Ca.IN.022.06.1.1]|uniref:hypothetical protein n=1 Tax=Mesorhizobium sp. M1A.F.Ca.IN.022.06.1.1 TaxID=2493680 RepID=UPI000F762AE0|nr:hypothetical protein [Mesorhizobium sp. M1A.F.Ca.IN.022.06.1.1]AZO57900.1 hypothetical protein EJ078_00155 [Mesorhizobium sp. M1A.F.Ca.IN.022.06.1.1]
MVRDAEAAGFNPLTALRNGGAAGFTSTTTPGNGLSAALSSMGNFFQNFDPMADQRREKELALLDAQVRNLNAETGAIYTRATASGPVKAKSGTAAISAAPGALEPGKLTATNPFAGRGVVDETRPDADAWESRYSDPGGWIGAIVNAGADLDANIRKAWPGADDVFARGRKAVKDWFRAGAIASGDQVQLPPLLFQQSGVGPLGGF